MTQAVVVHPHSKRPRIETDVSGTLHVYVAAQPIDGKANKALIVVMAKHLQITKNRIHILRGLKSTRKVLEVRYGEN